MICKIGNLTRALTGWTQWCGGSLKATHSQRRLIWFGNWANRWAQLHLKEMFRKTSPSRLRATPSVLWLTALPGQFKVLSGTSGQSWRTGKDSSEITEYFQTQLSRFAEYHARAAEAKAAANWVITFENLKTLKMIPVPPSVTWSTLTMWMSLNSVAILSWQNVKLYIFMITIIQPARILEQDSVYHNHLWTVQILNVNEQSFKDWQVQGYSIKDLKRPNSW